MTSRYKVMCGCDFCISSKIIHSSLLTWKDRCLKHLKYRIHDAQNRRSGEISICIFETYNNSVQLYGCHIYNTPADTAMETICPCTSKNHGPPRWKCLLRCCDKFPSIFLPSQEANKDTTNMSLTIRFHVYHNNSRCTIQG